MSRTVSAAARVLRVLKALKGHTVTGLSNTELAHITQDSPSNITRAMQTLIEEGLAVKLDNGRFAHSVGVLQIAQAHAEHMARLTNRMQELNQRIAAGSMN
ncbi:MULTISPECIES: helix-turn-helix domain-containing protein [Pseudomonas]|uniref:helix-turn-helix domain-containing protein n=1 Tax=Pseudomonas TaxID=286 RepID=UPI0005A63B91|nr:MULTISPECIES: helix-turn-helix domain-containing protein [Pseudomonas]AZD92026.1 Transcriptional regulator, IclR family [Pseudomonas chlororaphis subsp. aureofaciens]KAB0531352.1 helix-turn-helix domain-containing protein [Pseudomonas chlororaphis subsp. aureofaciens]TSD32324.1 helix-turn-helix domain-containing protein [Pseudomonas sp. ATCC 13985]WDG62898.1 helix-turn-helix domain-containing protein [Pseudomonas chlororaphis]WDG69165.1 helix-turn-helix domain-containing protein [Pseudomona